MTRQTNPLLRRALKPLLPILAALFIIGTGCGLISPQAEDESGVQALEPIPTVVDPIATIPLADAGLSPREEGSESLLLPPTFTPEPQGELLTGAGPGAVVQPPTEPISVTLSGLTYTIEAGDTLGEIATEYGVTLDELLAANDDLIENIDEIEVGWVLQIPNSDS